MANALYPIFRIQDEDKAGAGYIRLAIPNHLMSPATRKVLRGLPHNRVEPSPGEDCRLVPKEHYRKVWRLLQSHFGGHTIQTPRGPIVIDSTPGVVNSMGLVVKRSF